MPLSDNTKLQSALPNDRLNNSADANVNPTIFPWVKKLWFAMFVVNQYGRLSHFCGRGRPGNITMGTLRGYNQQQVKRLVEQAWDVILDKVNGSRTVTVQNAFDPDREDRYALESSSNHKRAFHKYKVAFRGDSRAPNDVLANGLKAKWQLPSNFLNSLYPSLPDFYSYIEGTPAPDGMSYNKANLDFFNETGVCVSRSLKGATKFPSPDDTQICHVYAVRVKNVLDTEAWQRKKGGSAPWRPGEKAVAFIPTNQILAHTKLQRSDYRGDADTKAAVWYKYKFLEPWTFTKHAMSDERTYISGELAGIIGEEQVFLRGEDFTIG